MSSFKETFTKNEKQDSNLEYDDTAFYYFFICILGITLIPLIYSLIKPIFFSSQFNQKQTCKCSTCKKKLAKLRKQKRFNWMTKGYIFTFIITIVISLLLKDCYIKLTNQVSLKSFDPFEILGIDPLSTDAEIKKAYRAMTIKYHPDKNKDDPQATAKFIKITKAYECLIDPKIRAVYEKYGNPDGPGLFNVAIALPSFLMKKENHVGVLCIFFFVLLIIIPGVIFYWHSNQKKYDADGLLVENKKLYYNLLNENMIAKSCPILVSYSKEFSDEILRQRTDTEKVDLTKLWHEVKTHIAKLPKFPDEFACHFLKCLILLSSYLLQLEIPEYLDDDILYILERVPSMLEKIIVFAASFPKGYKQLKYMGLRCLIVLIEFEQMIVQGLWINDHFLSQLSYFIENDVEKFVKFSLIINNYNLRKARKLTSLTELLKQDIEDRKVFNSLSEEDKQSINQELNYFPQLKVDYKVEVDGEEGIQLNDIITVTINLERMHINEGEEAGYVHSLKYPFVKEEYWYILIGDADNNTIFHIQLVNQECIILFLKLKELKKSFEHKFIFPATQPGIKHWTLYVKSDSYKGLDQQFPLDFEILPPETIKREVYVHPEDAELDNQPSLFTQIMQGMNHQSEDEEEEEEGNNDNNPDYKKSKKGKKNWLRKVQQEEQQQQEEEEEQDAEKE